jgi:MFS family permease
MPLFLQLVFGMNAGDSGLMVIPLTASTVLSAIMTGRLVAATGRYKVFPVIGLVMNAAGLFLLSEASASTPLFLVGAAMVLGGFGTGLVNPVLIVAVQNAVDGRDLGTATSSVSFFRSMGGSFGVALFGAVLVARLNALLGALPDHASLGPTPGVEILHAGAQAIAMVPEAIRDAAALAVGSAFQDLFRVGAGLALLTFACSLLLKELPLKTAPGAAQSPKPAEPPEPAANLGVAD